MKKELAETIKDAMIDHIYETLKLAKQTVITNDLDEKLYIRGNVPLKKSDHPLTKDRDLKGVKYFVPPVEYMKLIDTYQGISVDSLFIVRLRAMSMDVPKDSELLEIQEFLKAASYLVNNQPVTDEIKLTPKAINHYEKGLSFSKDFFNQNTVKKANIRSVWSFRIAIISSIIAIATTLDKLGVGKFLNNFFSPN